LCWQRRRECIPAGSAHRDRWRLRAVAEPPIICTHAQTSEAILAPKVIAADDLGKCRTLGATLAAGLAMGLFCEGPSASDALDQRIISCHECPHD
jgi:hypothetical protein